MSLQDDIFDIDQVLEANGAIAEQKAFSKIVTLLSNFEIENERLSKENSILKSAINIVQTE